MTSQLITSLEQAGEGSRELDQAVHEALGLPGQWSGPINPPRAPQGFWSGPHYTHHVDAALALAERVLPGWDWSVCRLEPNHGFAKNGLFYATVERLPDDWSPIFDASAKTPAIALCLAILRATNPKGQPNV